MSASEMDVMEESLKTNTSDIDDLTKENTELREKCRVLEGRLTRAEKEIEDLRDEQLLQQARSMRDNLKFFNIPEEKQEDCEKTL